MNLANVRADNLESINRANKIYQMLQIIDVKSLSDDEQKVIKVSMLNGLIHISSNLGMMNMARTYYDELVDITTDKKFETNISIYARYIYNFNIENYEKAEKIAYEYIKYHENMEEPDDNLINGGYIYLLEVSVALGDFETMEYAKDKFLKVKMKEPKERFTGMLKKIEGLAYEKKGDYAMALKKYNEAIEAFEKVENYENLIFINNKIINIASEISIDIESYVQNLQRYDKLYNKDKRLVEVADSIIKISHQKNNKAKKDLKNELDKNAKLIDFSRKINLIYSAVIICFICITIKVKNEITKRKEREVELEMMVKVDHMTKAYSKEFIFEKTNDYIKLGEKFTFIILDLDDFKLVNEKYGYILGDEILIEFANITKKLIGDDGCLGKFVGDEFIVLLDGKIEHSKFIDIVQETIAKTRYSKANVELTVSGGAIR
ncbi:MAG: GGDEF domain-containing protein [Sarcina sp.]